LYDTLIWRNIAFWQPRGIAMINKFVHYFSIIVALVITTSAALAHDEAEFSVESYLAENVPDGATLTHDSSPFEGDWFHLDGKDMYSQGSSFVVQNGICKFGADWYEHGRIPDGTTAFFTVSSGHANILPPAGKSSEKGYLNPWNDRVKKISCKSSNQTKEPRVSVWILRDVNFSGGGLYLVF